ncbi:MAG TPA: hypothetical protein DIT42_04125 [Gammaproteobacteria bacterium]|nr:hypothetical protein [Gammaproteobacteria bacterium]
MPALNRQRSKTPLSGTLQRDSGHARVVVLACVLMALFGCGQKGGLTRPESNPTPSAQFQ